MKLPEKLPEAGFYYHYKHDPNGPVNNYAYEVLSVGVHTEMHSDEDVEEDRAYFLNYRPLYKDAFVYKAGQEKGFPFIDNRPLKMWMEEITKDGKTFPRFTKITDQTVIAELEQIRDEMYK